MQVAWPTSTPRSPVHVLFLLIPVQAQEAPLRPPVLTVLAGHTPRESLSRTFCPQKGVPVVVIIMRFFWLGGLKEEGHEVSPAGHRGDTEGRGQPVAQLLSPNPGRHVPGPHCLSPLLPRGRNNFCLELRWVSPGGCVGSSWRVACRCLRAACHLPCGPSSTERTVFPSSHPLCVYKPSARPLTLCSLGVLPPSISPDPTTALHRGPSSNADLCGSWGPHSQELS